jgi:hypothetical protein
LFTIDKRLKNLKVNKAPGVDEIVPRILIENADYLSQPLEYIYRESLETGVVPISGNKRIRAAGLIALTRRLTINELIAIKKFNRA